MADLIDASRKGNLERVAELLREGVDVCSGDIELALRTASFYGHAAIVKRLLEAGANVHAEDNKALHSASWYGHTDVVKLLLDYGENVHAGFDGALWRASYNDYYNIVILLLDYGADRTKLYHNAPTEIRNYIPVNPRRVCVCVN